METTESTRSFARMAAGPAPQRLDLSTSTIEGATMSRERQEKAVDVVQYVFGGTLLWGVAL